MHNNLRWIRSFHLSSNAVLAISVFSALHVTVLPWSEGLGTRTKVDKDTLPRSTICNFFF